MGDRRVYGAFILLLTVAYIFFVNSLNFPSNYKLILYIPSIIMFALFLLLAMGKSDEERSVSDYFSY